MFGRTDIVIVLSSKSEQSPRIIAQMESPLCSRDN